MGWLVLGPTAELHRDGDLYVIHGRRFSPEGWQQIKRSADTGTELTTVGAEDGRTWRVAYSVRCGNEYFLFLCFGPSERFEVDGLDLVKAGWL